MPDSAQDIDRLLAPRSITIIGASEKPSIGRTLIESLTACGCAGAIYPVNPKYVSVCGYSCHSRLDDIDARVDVLALVRG
ncbi:MAG: CoA-binding protein [Gammaproteobacteria bacterium]|nr:CoA-binding protein [Gammaproteobacteria bacterium]MDH3467606.1 CoA-binding protein [Gammaproteobacteria bacterium]